MRHGVNIGNSGFASGNHCLSDLMRTASPFSGGDDPIRTDGFPTRVLASGKKPQAFAAQGFRLPAGTYALSARGTGKVGFQHSQFFADAGWHTYEFGPGLPRSIPIDAKGKDDGYPIAVMIASSDAADPLRGLALTTPDASHDHPFTQEFVHNLGPFSVLRFMQWSRVDRDGLCTWADYLRGSGRFNDASGASRKSLDLQIALCNLTLKDLWVNIYWRFDDESIRAMAAYIHERLDPRLAIICEFSNETWNGPYPQAKGIADAWAAIPADAPRGYQKLGPDQWMGYLHAHATGVFKAALPAARECVRLLAVQNAWPDRYIKMAEFVRASYPPGFEAISPAPYCYSKWKVADWDAALLKYASDPSGAIADVLASLRVTMAEQVALLKQWVAYAKSIGVPVICYEGGQELQPGEKYLPLYAAANRDPGMGALYRDFAAAVEAAGVDTLAWFQDCSLCDKNGAFGLKERSSDPDDVPKYAAVRAAAARAPSAA